MHARLVNSSRVATRAVHCAARTRVAVAAPAFAPSSTSTLQTRLFRTSPFRSQDGHIPLSSQPAAPTPSSAPKEDPSAHAVGQQEGHIPVEEAAGSSSAAQPTPSPAPIDDAAATTLPSEEIPAVSSSLDATQQATSSEPSSSPAPIDSETSTTLPTEEIPAVSSSLDAAQRRAGSDAARVKHNQERATRTVFVGGLSWNVDNEWLEDEVRAILDRAEGVKEVRIARNHTGRSKGFAFVELDTVDLAKQLVGLKATIDGREVEFTASTAPVEPRTRSHKLTYDAATGARNAPTNTVWLGNVAWSADEALLEKIFSKYGEIRRIGQPKDYETGRSRGIAYIEYATVDEASAAVQVGLERGFTVDGRPVRIDFASEAQRGEKQRRSSSRAGGRGRAQ
ncbi:hypothetical protein JCM10207_006918 [Rhodosporidiobolus poonsookiae]